MDKEMVKKQVSQGVEKAQQLAEREMKRVQKVLGDAGKKTQEFVKKNPEKAAVVAAGVGAAIGAALTLLLKGKGKKK